MRLPSEAFHLFAGGKCAEMCWVDRFAAEIEASSDLMLGHEPWRRQSFDRLLFKQIRFRNSSSESKFPFHGCLSLVQPPTDHDYTHFLTVNLNSEWELWASLLIAYLPGRRFIYENVAFPAGSCGFLFMGTVPLTFLSSYHSSQKSCHYRKQGFQIFRDLQLFVIIIVLVIGYFKQRRQPEFSGLVGCELMWPPPPTSMFSFFPFCEDGKMVCLGCWVLLGNFCVEPRRNEKAEGQW